MGKQSSVNSLILSILFLLCFSPVASLLHAQKSIPDDLDNFVQQVMQEFEVPGLSIAIVKDGEVVLTKGFGLLKLGESKRVDESTLFGIASNTKAFTATALALLVEEGKVKWDDPVIQYLPWFQMSDPYVTHEMTVRDLLVHRSGLGLGAGDLLWWPSSDYNRKEINRRLKYLPLATSFRSTYAYDNVLYNVAGELIETLSGQSWEEFISKRIFEKIGMNESKVFHTEAQKGNNTATPHARIEGKVRSVVPFTNENSNPAAAINSCAKDMAKWLITQLDSGRIGTSGNIYSPKTTVQLWRLITPMPIGNPPASLSPLRYNFRGYALGFDVQDYRGYKMVSHTGGLPGYLSMLSMIPEKKLGVVILTNQESGEAFSVLSYYILDNYLNAPKHDWLGAFAKIKKEGEDRISAAEEKATELRNSESHPSLPLESYAGIYNDRWYGDIKISYESGKLIIRFSHTPSLEGVLEHWQHDTFVAHWKDRELRADAFITFALNPDGTIDQAKMKAFSPATDFSFDFQDLLLKPVKQ